MGEFTRRPRVDGPPDLRWWGTGQIDDLDDLFGRKAAWCARAWRIGQDGRDEHTQIARVLLDGGELRFSVGPAAAPLAHGGEATSERLGERVVAVPAGRTQHDPHAERQSLGTGSLANQRVEERLLGR